MSKIIDIIILIIVVFITAAALVSIFISGRGVHDAAGYVTVVYFIVIFVICVIVVINKIFNGRGKPEDEEIN